MGYILHRFSINEMASQRLISAMNYMLWTGKEFGEIDPVHVSLRAKLSSN
jgi:hypothetical protein